jgi:hypothetical protein
VRSMSTVVTADYYCFLIYIIFPPYYFEWLSLRLMARGASVKRGLFVVLRSSYLYSSRRSRGAGGGGGEI